MASLQDSVTIKTADGTTDLTYEADVPTGNIVDTHVLTPGPITIGEALESAAETLGDKPVTRADASAIQSAEARATGVPPGVKGGPAAQALSAVDNQINVPVAEVLGSKVSDDIAEQDASSQLPRDKIVTPRDASGVQSAETRNNDGRVQSGGVASAMQAAAAYNFNAGFVEDPNTWRK